MIPTLIVFWSVALAAVVIHSTHAMTMTTTTATSTFPFVHPTIAQILECKPTENDKEAVLDTTTLQMKQWNTEEPMQSLIQMAHECDDLVFVHQNLPHFYCHNRNDAAKMAAMRQLMEWGSTPNGQHSNAKQLLVSLLALNQLETAIRTATGYATAGRAPLLKTMIQELHEREIAINSNKNNNNNSSSEEISQVLQALLLPMGLNLRNLLWHGFVAALPRPWLALVLVLICILERDFEKLGKSAAENSIIKTKGKDDVKKKTANAKDTPIYNFQQFSEYQPLLQRGEELRATNLTPIATSWIPERLHDCDSCVALKQTTPIVGQYAEWWELIDKWSSSQQYPLCCCILSTCLLEHALRQLWCRVNKKPDDALAQPGKFYVTLDGHGQRYQHDVLLHPYVGDKSTDAYCKNQLVYHLGGPIMALLTDVYCSPCGGPNLRAALAHGLYDEQLQQELQLNRDGNSQSSIIVNNNENRAWDMVRVLLTLVEAISVGSPTAVLKNYRPLFSYTASTCRNLEDSLHELRRLEGFMGSPKHQKQFESAKGSVNLPLESIQKLQVSTTSLHEHAKGLQNVCGDADILKSGLTCDQIFKEHHTNQILASKEAARTLLQEVSQASHDFLVLLQSALAEPDGTVSSRQRKQRLRILASSELALAVYGFAAFVAVLAFDQDLDNGKEEHNGSSKPQPQVDLQQAVKRSRMVVSTVSTFIHANLDRAIKAAKEFSQGKAVKAVLVLTHAPDQDQACDVDP